MKRISNILSIAFLLFWIVFVFLDYWQKHPIYYYSLVHFKYWGMVATLGLLGIGLSWAVLKYGKGKKPLRWLNGLAIGFLFLVIGVITAGSAYSQLVTNLRFDGGKAAKILLLIGGTAIALFLIVSVCYVLGRLLGKWLKWQVKPADETVVSMAAGIMLLVMAMFLIGAVSGLYWFVVAPIMLAVLVVGRKEFIPFFKSTLLQPITIDKSLNALGAGSFFLLLVMWAINFTAVNAPMPNGFDALTLYANLPYLIAQHHALVEGFQPYNWSVFMSLGHILFQSPEICLALSYLGGVLTAYAMYVLGRNWLGLNTNMALLATLLFSVTPSVTIQAYGEIKIDFGLLFTYLAVVILLLNFVKNRLAEMTESPETFSKKTWAAPEIILAGLLSGFALGTKLTTAYFAFAVMCGLWYAFAGRRGFFAAFLGSFFLLLLVQLDSFGGMRQYHLGADTLKWGVLVASMLLMAGIYISNKNQCLAMLRTTGIYGMLFLLPFLPWALKNHLETRSFDPQKVLNGKQAGPNINLNILEKNHGNNQ